MISYRPVDSEDGYFLMLASPDIDKPKKEKPQPKTVVFVVDRSGSMSGAKIDQAKEAHRFVLNNLHEGDTFNIVAYDSVVESFRPELARYNDDNREAALGFVEGIYAGGSTNIDGALKSALGMLQDSRRPSYVLFLTDGKPTVGERNEIKIAANAQSANQVRARVISLGVGYDVNSRLIDRLTRENFGQSEYVRPDEDIEEHVSKVYSRISSPVMSNVKVTFDLEESASDGKSVNRVYPRESLDVFRGDQIVMVGRYRHPGDAKITIKGRVGDKKQKFDFPAKLVKKSRDQSFAFVEKLWAMRRVGEIIDEIDLNGKNKELIDELMALATKHGIMTPYTSFLADETQPNQLASMEGRRRLERNLSELKASSGQLGFMQRGIKQRLKGAKLADNSASNSFYTPRFAESGGGRAPAGFGTANRAGGFPGLPAPPGGGGAGLGGGGLGASGPRTGRPAPTSAPQADGAVAGKAVTKNIRRIGSATLYPRSDNVWLAASAKDIDFVKDKAKIKQIKRFSKEYFALVKENTNAENAILAQQRDKEELVIRLRNVVYHIK